MDEFHEMLERVRQEQHTYRPAPEMPYKCPKCKDTGFLYLTDKNGRRAGYRCGCAASGRAGRMMGRSGISVEFQKKTFDNFDTKGNSQLVNAKEKAVHYAGHFEKTEQMRCNSIMFSGQVGAGKTHLGIAVCRELIINGVEVIYMPYRNAVTRIKQNIINEEFYSQEMERYASARALYIDDFLKGRLTDADINIMYEIVNYRYMNNLPLVISTEKSIDGLLAFDEAIGSRLIEMCRDNIIQLRGKELNYRLN